MSNLRLERRQLMVKFMMYTCGFRSYLKSVSWPENTLEELVKSLLMSISPVPKCFRKSVSWTVSGAILLIRRSMSAVPDNKDVLALSYILCCWT